MAEEENNAPSGANGEGAAPAPATTEPAKAMVQMTAEQLKSRLEEEREKSRLRVIKDLGFEKVDDAKNAFKVLKELQDAQLTEQQRLAKERDELKPKAERTAALEAQLAGMVDEQFATFPEAAQKAIDSVANGNAEKRLELMRMMKSAGLVQAGAAAPIAPVPPVSTGAGAPPPKAGAARTKHDELKELEVKSPYAAAIFYAAHQQEIERDRPAT